MRLILSMWANANICVIYVCADAGWGISML